MRRPDSWDDYCALNALTFFRGTKIEIRAIFLKSFHMGKKCDWISGRDKNYHVFDHVLDHDLHKPNHKIIISSIVDVEKKEMVVANLASRASRESPFLLLFVVTFDITISHKDKSIIQAY